MSKSRENRPQPQRSVASGLSGQTSQVGAGMESPASVASVFERAADASDRFWKSLERASVSILKVTAAVAATLELWAAYKGAAASASMATGVFAAIWGQLASRFPIACTLMSSAWSVFSGVIVGTGSAIVATLSAVWAALAPILVPVAALAAAAAAVWAVWSKWDAIPTWLKIIFPPLVILKVAVETIAAAFRLAWSAAKLFFDTVLLPFRLLVGAARLAVAAIFAIPSVLAALPGAAWRAANATASALGWMAGAAWSATQKITAGLSSLARTAVSAGVSITRGLVSGGLGAASWLAQAPGRVMGGLRDALWAVAQPLTEQVQKMFNKAASKAAEFGNALVGPITAAAVAFAATGVELTKLQSQYNLTAYEASTFASAARMTGRSVEELIKIMPAGSAAFAAFQREAQGSGLMLTEQEIGAARELSLAYARLKEAKSGLWQLVGATMAPAIKESTELVLGAVRAVTAWIRENKELVGTVFRVGSIMLGISTVLAGLGTAAGSVGAILGVLAMSAGALGTVLLPLAATVAAVAGGFAAWDTAAGRATRNLAGGVWDRYGASVMGAWQTTVEYGRKIVTYTQGVFQGVSDAIRGGNLELAVQVAWTGAQLAWVAGMSELSRITSGTLGAILGNLASGDWSKAADAAMMGVQAAWLRGLGPLKSLWLSLQDVWMELRIAADANWQQIVNAADTAFVRMLDAADPWWLAIQDGFRRGRDEVQVWVSATVAGIQTLAKTAMFFGLTFVKTILGPLQFLPQVASAASAVIAGLSKPSEFRWLAEASTEEVMQRSRPQSGGASGSWSTEPTEPGQRPGESQLDFLARVRRERRAADLAGRTSGRLSGASTRESEARWDSAERAALAAEEQAAREKQIADLEARIAYLQVQGDATAAAKAAALQTQLESAKSEAAKAAEEARMRGEGLSPANTEAIKSQVGKANSGAAAMSSAGTMSSASALAMFGGGGAPGEQLLKEQLREQRRIAADTRRSADLQDRMLQRFGTSLQFTA
jgi:hypothetical protein